MIITWAHSNLLYFWVFTDVQTEAHDCTAFSLCCELYTLFSNDALNTCRTCSVGRPVAVPFLLGVITVMCISWLKQYCLNAISLVKLLLTDFWLSWHWYLQSTSRHHFHKKKQCLLPMWHRPLFFIRPPDSLENLTATSPSTLAPVNASLMSFDGTVISTNQQVHVNRRSASCGDLSETDSRSQCEEERRTQQSQLTAKAAPRQGSNLSPSSQVIKSVFVQGVGWASQVRSTSSTDCCFF